MKTKALQKTAAEREAPAKRQGKSKSAVEPRPRPPETYYLGQELNWDAPWREVLLRVELPFWILVDNVTVTIKAGGHEYPVSIHCETFELQVQAITDSKASTLYRGPILKIAELSPLVLQALKRRPKPMAGWRKAKTVLIIQTRLNEDVWNRVLCKTPFVPAVQMYLVELCRGHLPIVNELIRSYRLATYDRFAHEVSPWDVPVWTVQGSNASKSVTLVSYRGWDHVPSLRELDGTQRFLRLIEPSQLRESIGREPTPGELELLDAINFMERGNYSDAIRRMATALEVLIESRVREAFTEKHGKAATKKFMEETEMNLPKRIGKYEELSHRKFSNVRKRLFFQARDLRHRIVHEGHRIPPTQRDKTQKFIDTGRWMFNWFENDAERAKIRENRAALMRLGSEMPQGFFAAELLSDGITVRNVLRESQTHAPKKA